MAGRKIGDAFIAVKPNVDQGFAGDVQRQGQSLGQRFGSSFTGSVLRYTARIGAGLAILGGVTKAFGFVKGAAIDFNSQLQQSTIAFTTMLGSGQKAKVFLDQLQQFAKTTPFEFTDLVKNAQNMMGMGIAAKDVIPDLRALGDSVASVGGSAQQVNSVTLAFDQMAAKGTLDMGNMNQILQNGVPTALKILAASYKVTTGQMIKMISTGKVQSSDALPRLIKGIEQGTSATAALGGMMDKQSQTFVGAMSNIKDSVTQALAGAFRPLFDTVSKGAQGFATWLGSPTFANFGTRVAKGISAAFTAVGRFIGLARTFLTSVDWSPFIRLVQTIWHVIADDLVPAIRNLVVSYGPQIKAVLGAAFGAVFAAVSALSPVLAAVGTAIKAFFGFISDNKATVATFVGILVAWKVATLAEAAAIKLVTAVQLLWDAAMSANPIGLIVIAVAAFAAGIVYLATKTQFFQTVWGAVWGFMKAVGAWFMNWGKFFLPALGPIGLIGLAAIEIYQHWSTVWGFMKAVASWFAGPFVGFFTGAKDKIVNNVFKPIRTAAQALASFFTDTLPGLFTTAWSAIKTAFSLAKTFIVQRVIAPLVNAFLTFVGTILHGAATAFGWVPGIGPNLKKAVGEFAKFKTGVNAQLNGILDEDVNVYVREQLIPAPGSKNRPRTGGLRGIGVLASGGPLAPYGWSWVGEKGPELIRAGAMGATVMSNRDSMGAGGIIVYISNSVIANRKQAEDMFVQAYDDAKAHRRIRVA
jgi:tape measure domain-containing protein